MSTPDRETVARGWLASTARDNTERSYREDLTQWFRWCDVEGIDALSPTTLDLNTYRRTLVRKYAPATAGRKLSALSSYYRYGALEVPHLVPHNPMGLVTRPRVSRESSTVGLDADETRHLLRVADRAGPRDTALLHLLAYTGARVSEVCGAGADDLYTERGHRTIQVERKGGLRQRLVLAAPAAERLATHLDGRRDGPLFPGNRSAPICRHTVARIVDRLVVAAGIDKHITPHSLRHTAATLALDAGVDIREVQRMLGHSSVETTMRYDRSISRVDRSPAHTLAAVLGG